MNCLHAGSCELPQEVELVITGLQSFTAQGRESLPHRDVPNGKVSLELVRIPSRNQKF